MDHPSRAAAARRASQMLEKINPPARWQPETDPPLGVPQSLQDTLQKAIDLQEGVDVLYQAAGRAAPEFRHISPLLIEKRHARVYLVAYCHNRRANRTFRLDRLKLIEPQPAR